MQWFQAFKESVKSNEVALISLFVAIFALVYSTSHEERYETNRTIRQAAFEVLKNLGELQVVVNASYFQKEKSDPMQGWGHIALIHDLSRILPAPVPVTIDHLIEVWNRNWSNLKTDEASVEQISKEIDDSRQAIVALLYRLRAS